jgi:PAS domain S-box-containing protein
MYYTNKDSVSTFPTTLFSNRLFLIIIFIVLEIFIVLFFFRDYRRHDDLYRTQMMQTLEAGYRGATTSYDQTTQMIFNDVVNKPEVLKLIASALDDKNKRDDYRNELYRLILPSYEKQKAIGISQFHFHLKDGTGFLRMHAPEKYGDNLFRRMGVYHVNKEQKPVKGYEVGYFADGYRFMYPLFYNGRHVGSVEFGITAEGIINHLNQIYPAYYIFMINRTIVDNMTYADWKKRNYRYSGLSDRFVIGQKEIENATITAINQKLKNRVSGRLTGMERFVEKERVNGKDYLIVFLPVYDVTGRPAAYFVQYMSDEYSGYHATLMIIDISLFTILLAGIFYSIDTIQSKRRSLEEKNIELEQMTETLHESEERFKALTEGTSDWIWEVDENAIYTYVSPKVKDLLGYEPKDVIGKKPFDFMPQEEARRVAEEFGEIVKAKRPMERLENINLHKDGRLVVLETSGVPISDAEGYFRGYRGIDRDITERKRMEDRIGASLEEKNILLKEIHHRVKNNMTIIYSLLDLQSKFTSEQHDREMLNDAKARIKAMALIHEKLYRSKDMAKIDFSDYLRDILNNMFMSHLKYPGRIALKIEVRDIALGIDDAIPCGLIINELVSNTLKHAFPEGRKGEITVGMRSYDNDLIELIVADNGIGLPADLDSRKKASMGLSLVDALVNQLHGKIELHKEEGTKFRITFRSHK